MKKTLNFLLLYFVLVSCSSATNSESNNEIENSSVAKTEIENIAPVPQDMPASIDEVITWDFEVKYISDCEVELIFKVEQNDGWHIYAQDQPEGAVALPTTFTYSFDKNVLEKIGKTTESKSIIEDEDGFAVRYFKEHQVTFKQKFKIKGKGNANLKLEYEYMACKEACFPPEWREKEFTLKNKCEGGNNDEASVENTTENPEENIEEEVDTNSSATDTLGNAVMKSPIGWKFYSVNKGDGVFEIIASASISSGHRVIKNFGEVLLDFNLVSNADVTKVGELQFEGFEELEDSATGKKYLQADSRALIKREIEVKNEEIVLVGNLSFSGQGKDKKYYAEDVPFTVDLSKSIMQEEAAKSDQSYLAIFIIAFLSGFLALLTPCVFPMIPMTVSFFTKQSKNKAEGIKNATIYGVSIIVLYVGLGLFVSKVFGSDALNAMSTNVYFNIFFFVLFVFFAISFFGAFEITLPNSWINKMDKNADRGGMIGIFFMAFTLALVSFSCTGPIVGTLLVEAATKGIMGPFFGMLGFSLALALPFALFAAFPGWLNSLPKSGGWLNAVKVSLGFIELALAFKFLSNADLVVQAHLLEREMFIAIWIGIFLLLTMYLLGVFKTSHDSPMERLSTTRLMFATVFLIFTIYLIPGMWGAPLKLISGFPPPMHYSESPYGVGGQAPQMNGELPDHAEIGPHGLTVFHDYNDALNYAREVNKPLMIDFTGHACVNCRKMEERVWVDEAVLSMLENDVVIASLYVDEKTMLPESERFTAANGKKIRTVGNKWSEFQARVYGSNTQPQYVLLDHEERMLNTTADYQNHGSADVFKLWLEDGLNAFENFAAIQIVYPEVKIVQ